MKQPNRSTALERRNRSRETKSTPAAPPLSALHRGVQFLQQGQLPLAKECFEQALLANPGDATACNCLGIVARNEYRPAEAIRFFRQAIALNPQLAEAHSNLGNALRDTGDLSQAAACYRLAVTIKPLLAEGHNNLGVVLLAQGEVAEAVRCFEEAIRIQPHYAEAHNNLANAYRQSGDLVAAAASMATALQLRPNSPEIHNNLANIWRETGQFELARQHYEAAVRLRADFAEAHDNLGSVLIDLEQGHEAIAAYERANALQPERLDGWLNLGNAYRLVGRVNDARNAFQRVADAEPHNLWHRLRIAGLCPPVFCSRREVEEHRQLALDTWPRLALETRQLGRLSWNARLAEPAFAWQFLDGNVRPIKEAYAEIFAARLPPRPPHSSRPRVGIVVTGGHEGLFLRSLAGVLERLSNPQFDLVLVCPQAGESVIRRGLTRDIPLLLLPPAFPQAVKAIEAGRFSVLYFWEIGTDATNYFLPFQQLAPVQCTSWGVQLTSGMRHVDYYLGSEWVEPPDAAEHYTEQLLLSPTLLTYQVPPSLPQPAKNRGAFGFRDEQHLYVCAQQLGKFHPDFDTLLAKILREDGQGVVVGVSDRGQVAVEILRARLRQTMPDVADRVVFLPRLSFTDYLQLLNLADVLLDPPHFGGVNSTYDALAIHQPIITLESGFHRGRYTAGCLRRMGMTETLARDADDFIRLAIRVAADRGYRDDLRHRIGQVAEVVFRDKQAVREHERLFDLLCQRAART